MIFRLIEMIFHKWKRAKELRRFGSCSDVKKALAEAEGNETLANEITSVLAAHTDYRRSKWDFHYTSSGGSAFFPAATLYALVRLLKPGVVIETGGTPGKSSAFLLEAMVRNAVGELYTLDIAPAASAVAVASSKVHEQSPQGLGPAWGVPSRLKSRQNLLIGDSKQTLPPLLERVGSVDIFIHDSDHSYQHMMWEFETAYPAIKPGGLLISDDIVANDSWRDFTARHSTDTVFQIANFGFLIKAAR